MKKVPHPPVALLGFFTPGDSYDEIWMDWIQQNLIWWYKYFLILQFDGVHGSMKDTSSLGEFKFG